MAGFTTAFSRTTLDAAIVNGDVIRYSEDGASATTHVAATSIAGWDASTDADPTLRKNTSAVDSAACDADAVVITHWSIWNSGSTVQKTDWVAFSPSETLNTGDKLAWAALACVVTLT
jgi:hypothetical protein